MTFKFLKKGPRKLYPRKDMDMLAKININVTIGIYTYSTFF